MSRNNIQLGANGFSPGQTRGLGLGVYVGHFVFIFTILDKW